MIKSTPQPLFQHKPKPRAFWTLFVLLIVAGMAVLPFDHLISRWFSEHCSGFIEDILDVSESYGNGIGAVLILLGVGMMFAPPARLRVILRLLAMSLGAGLVINILKLLVERTRPRGMTELTGWGWESFQSILPLFSAGSTGQSFPSAHSATAAGLSVGLFALAPRGRWFFFLPAALVMLQRVESKAHFPSDTLFGAAVGLMVAWLLLPRDKNLS